MFRISADTEGTVSDITPADCVGDYVPGKYVAAVYDLSLIHISEPTRPY